jgi:endonuclease/exonuclease/phosphatase family metal-dependent hydrolase
VWFDFLELKARTKLIMKELMKRQPDVACFQEVLPLFASMLAKSKKVRFMYSISPYEPGHGYGNITLVKHEHKPSYRIVQFPTMQGRKLLLAYLNIYSNTVQPLIVGNVHLESLDRQATREAQLDVCRSQLKSGRSVLVGDFNISADDAQYRQRAKLQAQRQLDQTQLGYSVAVEDTIGFEPDDTDGAVCENDCLARSLPGFIDAWHQQVPVMHALLQLRREELSTQTRQAAQALSPDSVSVGATDAQKAVDDEDLYHTIDELGYTFDEAVNNMSNKTRIERKRIDRVLASLEDGRFEFGNIMRIGTSIYSTSAGGKVKLIYPSDHFGLLCTYVMHCPLPSLALSQSSHAPSRDISLHGQQSQQSQHGQHSQPAEQILS